MPSVGRRASPSPHHPPPRPMDLAGPPFPASIRLWKHLQDLTRRPFSGDGSPGMTRKPARPGAPLAEPCLYKRNSRHPAVPAGARRSPRRRAGSGRVGPQGQNGPG
jgi:hypothetical protein